MKILVKQTDLYTDFKKYGLPTYAVTRNREVCKNYDEIKKNQPFCDYYRGFFSEIEVDSLNEVLEVTKKWNEKFIVFECDEWAIYHSDKLHYEYVLEILLKYD